MKNTKNAKKKPGKKKSAVKTKKKTAKKSAKKSAKRKTVKKNAGEPNIALAAAAILDAESFVAEVKQVDEIVPVDTPQ